MSSTQPLPISGLEDSEDSSLSPFFKVLSAETRREIFEFVYKGITFRPRCPGVQVHLDPWNSSHRFALEMLAYERAFRTPPASISGPVTKSSDSLESLRVNKQWKKEAEPFIVPYAIYDFSGHFNPFDQTIVHPPSILPDYHKIRTVRIQDTNACPPEECSMALFPSLELCIFEQHPYCASSELFDEDKLSKTAIEDIKADPVSKLFVDKMFYTFSIYNCGPKFFSEQKPPAVHLEGILIGPDGDNHTVFRLDLDKLVVKLIGLKGSGYHTKIQLDEAKVNWKPRILW